MKSIYISLALLLAFIFCRKPKKKPVGTVEVGNGSFGAFGTDGDFNDVDVPLNAVAAKTSNNIIKTPRVTTINESLSPVFQHGHHSITQSRKPLGKAIIESVYVSKKNHDVNRITKASFTNVIKRNPYAKDFQVCCK